MLTLTLLMLTAQPTSPERRAVHVEVTTIEGCPVATEFARRLAYRTERIRLVATPAEASAWLEVKLEAAGLFRGALSIRTADGREERTLQGKKCLTVVDALALAAALLLDPEAKQGPVPLEAPLPAISPEPIVAPPTDAGADVPIAPALPVAEADAGPPAKADAGTPEPSLRPVVTVAAAAHTTTALSGGADFGGGAVAELALESNAPLAPVAHLELGVGSGQTLSSAAGTMRYPLHVTTRVELGARLRLARAFEPELSLGVHVLTMEVSSLAAQRNVSSLRWLPAPALSARLHLVLGEWRVFAHGALGAHLLVERYRVEPDGEVFAVPPLFGFVALGVGRSFR